MEVSAWSGNTYGVRVGYANRDKFFNSSWDWIEVEIENKTHRFRLTGSFWDGCPEFRDSGGTVIQDWLRRNYTVPWPNGSPPRFKLEVIGEQRFRLEP
ncbi:MAG: hypothetical protein Pg6A_02810 [Termitinemataceae bacterium]|nr:MAG: hypothetical protein Pg6A_02810 [Termitinemataceae bacterium]